MVAMPRVRINITYKCFATPEYKETKGTQKTRILTLATDVSVPVLDLTRQARGTTGRWRTWKGLHSSPV